MSLNWDVSKVENFETVCFMQTEDGKDVRPTTTAIIWRAMIVGIGTITEKNAAEFYARSHLIDLVNEVRKEERISALDIRKHIGLRTNVSDESRTKFVQRNLIKGKMNDWLHNFGKVGA